MPHHPDQRSASHSDPSGPAAQAAHALQRGRERHGKGAYAEAAAYFREATRLREQAYGAEDPRTLEAVRHEAAALAAIGELEGAAELQARALAGASESAARSRARLADDAAALARLLGRLRSWDDAAALWLVVLRERRATLGADHPDTTGALAQLATAWQSGGHARRAERAWRRLLAAREAAGASATDLAAVRERIADCLTAQEQRGEALAMRLRAMGDRTPEPAPADATRTARRATPAAGLAQPGKHSPTSDPAPPPDDSNVGPAGKASGFPPWRSLFSRRALLLLTAVLVVISGVAVVRYEGARVRRAEAEAAERQRELAPPVEEPTTPPSLGAPSTEVYRPR